MDKEGRTEKDNSGLRINVGQDPKYIYVAGPIALGDTILNIKNAIDMGEWLLNIGFIPFIPHVDFIWHYTHPKGLEDWLKYDFAWILKCDALLALPGESKGTQLEIEFAQKHNIPVFHNIESLVEWRLNNEEKNS